MMVALRDIPLRPAGHLLQKGGDWLGARSSFSLSRFIPNSGSFETIVMPLVISPPVGEIPGRAEGGDLRQSGRINSNFAQETHDVPRP